MENRLKLPTDDLVILPKDVLAFLKDATADQLKVLIYCFSDPDCDLAAAVKATGLTASGVESAFAFWQKQGIFAPSEKEEKKKTAPSSGVFRNYDSETLSNAMESDAEFSTLCDLACEKLEKQLTKNDFSTLFYLYDFVRMPMPVICGVIEDCCNRGKKSLQYIYKRVVGLYEDGIDSYDRFEEYMAEQAHLNSNIGALRKLFGMGERALTAREEKLFGCWFSDWKMPFELVRLAYEKTVDTKGMLSTTYMNGILRRWHDCGYCTLADVANGESSRKDDSNSSFVGEDFIEAALSRGFEEDGGNK